jgi:hypothetical protein
MTAGDDDIGGHLTGSDHDPAPDSRPDGEAARFAELIASSSPGVLKLATGT